MSGTTKVCPSECSKHVLQLQVLLLGAIRRLPPREDLFIDRALHLALAHGIPEISKASQKFLMIYYCSSGLL